MPIKTKVYDVNLSKQTEGFFCHQPDEHSTECACMALTEDVEPELDAEFMEVMLAAEDQDELLVSSFEQELEDFHQDVPDMPMHDAMVTYLEARSKLLENVAAVTSGQSSPVERTTVVLEKERAAARERGSETYFWLVLPDRPAACKRAIGKRNAPTGTKN